MSQTPNISGAVSAPHFYCLSFADVDRVLEIEEQVYSHPWTRGNFHDSLYSAHQMLGLQDASNNLIGYYVLMPVVDEMHLLNFAIATQHQGLGYARILLDHLCASAREQRFLSILLEVRLSNLRALSVYTEYGFSEIGRRKSYYPVVGNLREDAIVMRIEL
ncbi:ribosomal protein S18-alanine N-acetyltransferase [Undibacterium sp. Ren11W]|uniref:ribosomal protein S18-alanine N-acetyltransferase n=1 Tax=Undibacterium sp. Ren11W TaxID=3413045 RepID=UPI003BEF7EB6